MSIDHLDISAARRGPNRLNSPRSAIHILAVAALLAGARFIVDLTSAAAYVYPDFDFGQFWIALFILLIALVFVIVLAVVRLFQRRFIEGLALFAVLYVPFSFQDAFDRHYWKFQTHKAEYQSAIRADPTPPPKYRIFSWGNRNTYGIGGGVTFEAIVYDESDEIALSPEKRSLEWVKRRANPLPSDRWVTTLPEPYPTCKRLTKPLGGHFYYLSEEC